MLQSTALSPLSSSGLQVGMPPNILDQWRGIVFNRFVINMVKLTTYNLGGSLHYSIVYSGLTLGLQWPIIQKEVDELLAKGATELLTGCAGF